MKRNAQVGFIPLTRACFKNKNVRHELVANEYYMAKRELKNLGSRTEGIFDVQLSTVTSVQRKEWEEDKL